MITEFEYACVFDTLAVRGSFAKCQRQGLPVLTDFFNVN